MATPRDIRYIAFLALFQLDAREGADAEAIRDDILAATEPLREAGNVAGKASTPPSRGRQPLSQSVLTEIDWKADFIDALKGPITEKDVDTACAMADEAWKARREADKAIRELAPTWPAHRQPAVDRALIRLAHWEMTASNHPPKAVINEVLEIAKAFSTDRSASFINGVLDKVLKRVLAAANDPSSTTDDESTQ